MKISKLLCLFFLILYNYYKVIEMKKNIFKVICLMVFIFGVQIEATELNITIDDYVDKDSLAPISEDSLRERVEIDRSLKEGEEKKEEIREKKQAELDEYSKKVEKFAVKITQLFMPFLSYVSYKLWKKRRLKKELKNILKEEGL